MAITIEQIKAQLLELYPESQFEIVPSDDIERIRREHPGIPEDYLRYLAEVGFGAIGGMGFMVYSGPCHPSDIYDESTAESLSGIILIGDNFSGDCVGYDTKAEWKIGEVGSSCQFDPLYGEIDSFLEMLNDRFLTDS